MSDWVPTTCMRCAVGCGHVQRGVDAGYGLDVVRGNAAHPVNRGLACKRGVDETADPGGEWLTRPLIRENGELVRTTWETALTRVVDRFSEITRRNADGVAVLGSGQQTNEAAYALGKLARGGFNTRHYDANTTLCMASAVTAYYDAFGSDAPPPTYDDIPDATRHVVWGANPAVAHPVMFRWIADSADEDDSELIVVDPIETQTAEVADAHVALDPGGDLALARAVLARIVETGRVDREFVDRHTEGFDSLAADLPPVEEAAAEAGVGVGTVESLAAAFEEPTLVYWGMGINQSVHGTDAAGALIDCCLASGNLRPGSGPFSLTGQANSMGTRVCSSKGTWPGHRPFEDPDARADVADAWGVDVADLPDDAGPGPVGIADAVGDEVEAVYAVATNPVAGLPDAAAAAERLDDAFLVVQDAFRTETVELADVVLPAATWGESSGTTTNMERRVSRVRAASELPSGVRTDLEIIATLGDWLFPDLFDAADPESVFDEFRAMTAGTPADLSGISYERLEAEHAVRWPAPDAQSEGGYRYHREGGDWEFPTPSGRARFSTGQPGPLPEPTDDDYPLTLTNGREADGYNTGVRSRESPEEPGELVARVNPATVDAHRDVLAGSAAADSAAAAAGAAGDDAVTDGGSAAAEGSADANGGAADADAADGSAPAAEVDDRLRGRIESRRASVAAVIEPDEAVPEGTVWLSIHHPATNRLTLPETDPRSDEPNYKQCAVRLVAPESEPAAIEERA